MTESQAKIEVIEAGKELVKKGLVARTWGNISCRIDDKSFAITPSGIGYERLTPESIVVVDMESLEHKGDIKPSSEKRIHATAYKLHSDTNFVIHTHQTYASAISVSGFEKLMPTNDELKILGGKIRKAAYGLPGTKKLSNNVKVELSQNSNAVLLEKHGALLTGSDRDEAFRRSTTLEDVCKRACVDIELSDQNKAVISSRNDNDLSELHKSLYAEYPEFDNIAQLDSPLIDLIMKTTSKLAPVLDDFAQMIGPDAKICTTQAEAVKEINKRNCVFLKGVGAICCSASEDDCHALLTLVDKNGLAYLNAKTNGKVEALSFLDKKLMRYIYTKKYSKKK